MSSNLLNVGLDLIIFPIDQTLDVNHFIYVEDGNLFIGVMESTFIWVKCHSFVLSNFELIVN